MDINEVPLSTEKGYAYNFYGKTYSSVINLPIHIKQDNFKSYYPLQNVFERATKLNIWINDYEKLLLDNIIRELLIIISTELATPQCLITHLRRFCIILISTITRT